MRCEAWLNISPELGRGELGKMADIGCGDDDLILRQMQRQGLSCQDRVTISL